MSSSHDDIIVGGEGSKSFFSYMFSLTSTEKNDLLNMVQYVILAIIPIIIMTNAANILLIRILDRLLLRARDVSVIPFLSSTEVRLLKI